MKSDKIVEKPVVVEIRVHRLAKQIIGAAVAFAVCEGVDRLYDMALEAYRRKSA
ncbi:MAG: hypothetical protein ABWY25_09665 [Paenisporosarcina sp.]